MFRNEALPLIDEERFAPMYHPDNGRPNRAVQTVLGIHILKEMFNLTDQDALEQLEFNLLRHRMVSLGSILHQMARAMLPRHYITIRIPSSSDHDSEARAAAKSVVVATLDP